MKCAFSKFSIDEEIFAEKITFKCQSCIRPLVIHNARAINKGHGELSSPCPLLIARALCMTNGLMQLWHLNVIFSAKISSSILNLLKAHFIVVYWDALQKL